MRPRGRGSSTGSRSKPRCPHLFGVVAPEVNHEGGLPRPFFGQRQQARRGVDPGHVVDPVAIVRQVEARTDADFEHPAAGLRDHAAAQPGRVRGLHRQVDDPGQNESVIEAHRNHHSAPRRGWQPETRRPERRSVSRAPGTAAGSQTLGRLEISTDDPVRRGRGSDQPCESEPRPDNMNDLRFF